MKLSGLFAHDPDKGFFPIDERLSTVVPPPFPMTDLSQCQYDFHLTTPCDRRQPTRTHGTFTISKSAPSLVDLGPGDVIDIVETYHGSTRSIKVKIEYWIDWDQFAWVEHDER